MPTQKQCPECEQDFDVRGLPTHRYHAHGVESAVNFRNGNGAGGRLADVETIRTAYIPISRLRSSGNSERLRGVIRSNDRTFVTVDEEPMFELTPAG